MRKLIESTQPTLVVCDNPKCDFEVPCLGDARNMLHEYINLPCPKCGQNLLTAEDYMAFKRTLKLVDFINKWFSWINVFIPGKFYSKTVSVHHHEGNITIKTVNN